MKTKAAQVFKINFKSTSSITQIYSFISTNKCPFSTISHQKVGEIKKMKIGDPLDRSTDHGPQNHKAHLEKLLEYCDIGQKEGATLVYGGKQVDRPGRIHTEVVEAPGYKSPVDLDLLYTHYKDFSDASYIFVD